MSSQDILVLAETKQDAVAEISLELLAAARGLAAATGGQVLAAVLSASGESVAAALEAADRILLVNDPLLADYAPEPYVAVLEKLVEQETPRAVLLGSTTIGLDVGPLLGARLGAPVVDACQKVAAEGDALKVTSSICGGKVLADSTVSAAPAILLMLPGAYRPSEEKGQAQVQSSGSPVALEPGAVSFQEMILPETGDVDITQQDILVAVGRGIQQEDNMEVAEELAKALGGELAASRPIVDQGWLPTTRQVGKSGMIVKPKLYLTLGISGAPEHQEGMAGSELVIAVNTDPNAPIFDVAQYGTTVDLLDLAPALTEAIQAKKGG